MPIKRISREEIEAAGVSSLSTRPNSISRYGVSGMTPSELRAAFDSLAKLAISRLNQVIDAINAAGGDSEDLIQEGMFGLIRAIREYDGAKAASFRTFAEVCIRNRLISALRAASRDKHSPLNQSVPLDTPFFDGNSLSLIHISEPTRH